MSGGAIVFWLIVCGIIAMFIGQEKHINMFGSFVLGALLGVIGIVIMLFLPKELPKAPDGTTAVRCPRCNTVQNVPLNQAQFECWQCKQIVGLTNRGLVS
jgi:LSD1 subclass zinc finger protein